MKRTMLFCPSIDPEMMLKTEKYSPDAVIFDLEDSVALTQKEHAREVLQDVMSKHKFKPYIYVRINGAHTPFFEEDVKTVVQAGISYIRLAMCESAEDVALLDERLSSYEKRFGTAERSIKIQCSLETPNAVYNAMNICKSSSRVESLSFGSEDYTNILGVNRTKDYTQFLYARSHLAMCAAILGIGAYDAAYTDLKDLEGFEKEVLHIINLGFTGKTCIHPKQVAIANRCFIPTDQEIEYAKSVIDAFIKAGKDNAGVIQYNGKMLDKPVIEKAQKVLNRAGVNYAN